MDVTILNYINQDFVNQVNQHAIAREAARAEEARIAAEAAAQTANTDFASALENASSGTSSTTPSVVCPENLTDIFAEASAKYGVSEKLLLSIAKTESNFNPAAVSSAGAMGIMQLMPATASALGVTNAFDARENIMGGASLMAQHLQKYQGNVSLALAAYNAGSNAVDQYGGIPPYTETQNYVQKVLGYMDTDITVPAYTGSTSSTGDSTGGGTVSAAASSGNGTAAATYTPARTDTSALDTLSALTGDDRDKANAAIESYFASQNISLAKLQKLITALQTDKADEAVPSDSDISGPKQFTVTILDGIQENL